MSNAKLWEFGNFCIDIVYCRVDYKKLVVLIYIMLSSLCVSSFMFVHFKQYLLWLCDHVLQGDGDSAAKTAKKIYNQKFAELSGNDIFRGEVPPSSAEKSLSGAKLREITGSNIFAD